jgi:myosin heavy subunit
MSDPEELIAAAIEQIQKAASQLKQKQSIEAKMWQKKAQELESVVDSLQSELRAVQQANAQMRASLEDANSELENLRSVNASLTRSLQEKEQTVSRYVSLNRSLRGLLDEPPEETLRLPLTRSTPSSFMNEPTPTYKRPSQSVERVKSVEPAASPPRGPSQGSVFLKAAKDELTYSDFNQMIGEINLYNKHQQSREETIANVKGLLCPMHKRLFEQFLPMIGGK